jgi:hypothetical protein
MVDFGMPRDFTLTIVRGIAKDCMPFPFAQQQTAVAPEVLEQ